MNVADKVREWLEEAPREQILDLRDLVVKLWGNANSQYYKVIDFLHYDSAIKCPVATTKHAVFLVLGNWHLVKSGYIVSNQIKRIVVFMGDWLVCREGHV